MNYYNEFDPAAAAWLRELIALGLLPPGEVDERSIKDVRSSDLGYDQCHFFAGIGGWSLALRLAGWPEDRPVWTGSCPCQPYSTAGKQRGNADERDLWPEFFRLIAERRPQFIFGEQVENAVRHGWLDRVCRDLEGEGYAVGAAVLGAHSVGAPHRRQRLYWGAVSVPHAARIGRNEWRSRTGRRGALSGCGVDGMAENADGGGMFRLPKPPCERRTEAGERYAGYTGRASGIGGGMRMAENADGGDAEGGVMEIRMGTTGKYKLRDYAATAAWMTCKASDGEFTTPRTSGRPPEKSTHLQTQVAVVAAWSTASARDWKDTPGMSERAVNPDGTARRRIDQLPRTAYQVFLPGRDSSSSSAGTGKCAGYRLNPYFSAWLMGFPKAWTDAGLRAFRKLAAFRLQRKERAAQCC